MDQGKRGLFFYSVFLLVLISGGTAFSQQLPVLPSTMQPAAAFGYSLAHSGEWMIVGAKDDTTQLGKTGAAYFFKYENEEWVEKQKVSSDNGSDGDLFGISVSIYGSYAVATANGDDTQGINTGAAFIYKKEGEEWLFHQKLVPHIGNGFDEYGIGVSMIDELMVVGAYSDTENGPFSGAAYIYFLVNDTWIEDANILPDDGVADDKFGRSVSTDGEKVIVCGVLNDDMGMDSGSAYIFSKVDGTWQQEIKLLPPDGEENDRFGRSVGIDNEYVAIGSVLDDDNGESSGSVYIYHKEIDGWIMQSKLTPDDGAAGDFFGYSLSLSGRYLIVGAHNNDDFGLNSGSAYLFTRIGTEWVQTEKFSAEVAHEGDNYGESVFIDDAWIIIGSPYYTTSNGITGAAFAIAAPLPVGIPDIDSPSLTVHPNPVTNILNLSLNDRFASEVELSILDAKGNTIINNYYPLRPSSASIAIVVDNLQPGIYIAVIKIEKGVFVSKFYKY